MRNVKYEQVLSSVYPPQYMVSRQPRREWDRFPHCSPPHATWLDSYWYVQVIRHTGTAYPLPTFFFCIKGYPGGMQRSRQYSHF